MRVLFLLTIVVPSFSIQASAQVENRLNAAEEAYGNDQYEEAITQYRVLESEGYRAPALYYNLGNAYYRMDSLAQAVLAYERALVLDPGDEDTRHNLELLRSRLTDRIEAIPGFFLRRWWENARDLMSPGGWSLVMLLCIWLGLAGLVLWRKGKVRRQRQWGFLLGWMFLLLSLLPFFLASGRQAYLQHSGRAVIMDTQVVLRSAPELESRSLMDLHEGTVVELLDIIGNWHKVELADGEQGWLPSVVLEEI